jgi:hypothetical protein
MSSGLQVLNDSGDIIVDGTYANHQLVESGSYTQAGASAITTVNFATALNYPPLIFVSCSEYLYLFGYTKSGSQYTGFKTISGPTSAAHTVYYHVCAPSPAVSSDTWGMRVWDASSNLVFESGRNYMKIKDVVSYTTPTAGLGSSSTINTVSGITDPYACLNAVQGRGTRSIGFAAIYFGFGVKKVSDSQWLVASLGLYQFTNVGNIDHFPTTQNLVVASTAV